MPTVAFMSPKGSAKPSAASCGRTPCTSPLSARPKRRNCPIASER